MLLSCPTLKATLFEGHVGYNSFKVHSDNRPD